MINHFRVHNFKALRSLDLELTPVHALIGPNDSGKTTILQALKALSRTTEINLPQALPATSVPFWLTGEADIDFDVRCSGEGGAFDYHLGVGVAADSGWATLKSESFTSDTASIDLAKNAFFGLGWARDQTAVRNHHAGTANLEPEGRKAADLVRKALSSTDSYRWDPAMLSLPNAPDSRRSFRMERSGFGLVRCLDDIVGFDRQWFGLLEEELKRFFPRVRSIKLRSERSYRNPGELFDDSMVLERAEGKGLYFELADSPKLIPAGQMSDGVMLVLAFLALLYLPSKPQVILLDEPDNGIHPKRLKEVMGILRRLVQNDTSRQIVLTTHSPYLVDLFEPDEVTLCRMDQDGSVQTTRLSQSAKVRDQLDVFTLGEIWTAEGDEAITSPAIPIARET